jgi:hypothetical protein
MNAENVYGCRQSLQSKITNVRLRQHRVGTFASLQPLYTLKGFFESA